MSKLRFSPRRTFRAPSGDVVVVGSDRLRGDTGITLSDDDATALLFLLAESLGVRIASRDE